MLRKQATEEQDLLSIGQLAECRADSCQNSPSTCITSQKSSEGAKALYMEGEEEGVERKYTIENQCKYHEARAEAGMVPGGDSSS